MTKLYIGNTETTDGVKDLLYDAAEEAAGGHPQGCTFEIICVSSPPCEDDREPYPPMEIDEADFHANRNGPVKW